MRTVYRLQGLVRRYGADRVERACSLSLDLDVVSVNKIASMLERGTESTAPATTTSSRTGNYPVHPQPIGIQDPHNIIDRRHRRNHTAGDLT